MGTPTEDINAAYKDMLTARLVGCLAGVILAAHFVALVVIAKLHNTSALSMLSNIFS